MLHAAVAESDLQSFYCSEVSLERSAVGQRKLGL